MSKAVSSCLSGHGNPGIYLSYAAVSVADGVLDTLILPYVNTDCMQVFVDEVAARHPTHRVVMVIDGAGWHRSDSLVQSENMRLVKLPPYAPELNPVEHLWDDLREKSFHDKVFKSIDALEDHLSASLRDMELDTGRVHLNFTGAIGKWLVGNVAFESKPQGAEL